MSVCSEKVVGWVSRMNLVVGRLQCNPAGYGFVAPETRGTGQSDVFVSAVNIREALHGDRVVVRRALGRVCVADFFATHGHQAATQTRI